VRIHGIPESTGSNDDGESAVMNIAKVLNVELNATDIQRAHRLGKKKTGPNAKARPIIESTQ